MPEKQSLPQKWTVNDGDVITLPSVVARWDKSVALAGRVERAGNYEWRQGLSLGDVLRSTEQLGRDAYRAMAIVERTDSATGVRSIDSTTASAVMFTSRRTVAVVHPEIVLKSNRGAGVILFGAKFAMK